MTFAAEKLVIGREPITLVELDLDICSLVYGIAPCTASGPVGSECFNTRNTCQDPTNYTKATKTYTLCEHRANLPVGVNMIPCVKSASYTATKITPGKGLGNRGAVTVTLEDFAHHDRGIDPYVATRSYDPEAQGTFFGKLIARNPYYIGRIMRVKSGYITDPWDTANFENRTFVIEKIEGPDRSGRIKITGKDLLKLADNDRAQCPAPSKGKLLADITNVATSLTLTPTGIGSTYATSGTYLIGDEYGTFTRSGDTITLVTRGDWGTAADEHKADDTFQEAKVYLNANVVDITYDQLVNYAGINPAYIPYATDWAYEKAQWLSFQNFTTVIGKPEGVQKLLEELTEQALFDLWGEVLGPEIKLKAIAPPLGNETITEIGDDYHLLADSINVADDPGQRVSQVWVYWNKINHADDNKEENYRSIYIAADLNKEDPDQYGSSKIKKIVSRWISSEGQAAQLAGRLIARFNTSPKIAKFALDMKDSDIWTGGLIDMNSRQIQDFHGANLLHRMQILSAQEAKQGHRIEYEAMTSSFEGRYGFIAPNTLGDYSAVTEEERRRYAFICYNTNVFLDGEPAYKVI